MNTRFLRKLTTPALAIGMGLFAVGCDGPLTPDEHPEAGGVVIFEEGTRTVLAMGIGQAAFNKPIVVPVGGSLEVEVLFLNEADPTNHALAFLPHEDEGESLEIDIANETIVGFAFRGDHADFGGLATGTTTATFSLMHGGHSDFSSGTLTIVVQ